MISIGFVYRFAKDFGSLFPAYNIASSWWIALRVVACSSVLSHRVVRPLIAVRRAFRPNAARIAVPSSRHVQSCRSRTTPESAIEDPTNEGFSIGRIIFIVVAVTKCGSYVAVAVTPCFTNSIKSGCVDRIAEDVQSGPASFAEPIGTFVPTTYSSNV